MADMTEFDRAPDVSGRARVKRAVSALFSFALLASVVVGTAPAVAQSTPAQEPAGATPPPAAQWSDAGWAKGAGLVGGDDALGTVLIDWQADADAKAGDTFDLRLPAKITGDPRDPEQVELADTEGYLGATGQWSADRDSIEFRLEQDGTVTDEETDQEHLLGGTFEFDVVWSDPASLKPGVQKLTFQGPGFDGTNRAQLTAEYVAPRAAETTPEKTTAVGPTTANKPAKPTTGATAPGRTGAEAPGTDEADDTDADTDDEMDVQTSTAAGERETDAGAALESADPSDPADTDESEDQPRPWQDRPVADNAPDRQRPAVEADDVTEEQAHQVAEFDDVLGGFSALVSMTNTQNVNEEISVTIGDKAEGFRVREKGRTDGQLWVGDQVDIRGTWDATEADVVPGDQFVIGLPEQLRARPGDEVGLYGADGEQELGSCAITLGRMVCTLSEEVRDIDPGDLTGELVLQAQTRAWVRAGQGVDLDINGTTVNQTLPGDGGIEDGFTQPERALEAVDPAGVKPLVDSYQSTWALDVPGQEMVRAAETGTLELEGTFAADELGELTGIAEDSVVLEAGRVQTEQVQGLSVTEATVSGSDYRVRLDVSGVDAELLDADLGYRLTYEVELGELTSDTQRRRWTLGNTVSLSRGAPLTASVEVTGERGVADRGEPEAMTTSAAAQQVAGIPGVNMPIASSTGATPWADVPITPSANPPFPATCGMDVTVVVDTSSSMNEEIDDFKYAASRLAEILEGTSSTMRVIPFGDETPSYVNPDYDMNRMSVNTQQAQIQSNIDKILLQAGDDFVDYYKAFEQVLRDPGDVVLFVTTSGHKWLDPNYDFTRTTHRDEIVEWASLANQVKDGGARIVPLGIDYGGFFETSRPANEERAWVPPFWWMVRGDDGLSQLDRDYYMVEGPALLERVMIEAATQGCVGSLNINSKVRDLEGNLTDEGGFQYEVFGAGLVAEPSVVVTDPYGRASTRIREGDGTSTVIQDLRPGYELEQATCEDNRTGQSLPVTVSGNTFTVPLSNLAFVSCTVINVTRPITGDLTWEKISDHTGERLEGSQWTLTNTQTGAVIHVEDCVGNISSRVMDWCSGPDLNPDAGGLRVADLELGTYELVETVAPPGYVLDPTPRRIEVVAGELPMLTVTNTQREGLIIPLTGGTGAQIFFLGGLLLAAATGGAMYLRHRQNRRLGLGEAGA